MNTKVIIIILQCICSQAFCQINVHYNPMVVYSQNTQGISHQISIPADMGKDMVLDIFAIANADTFKASPSVFWDTLATINNRKIFTFLQMPLAANTYQTFIKISPKNQATITIQGNTQALVPYGKNIIANTQLYHPSLGTPLLDNFLDNTLQSCIIKAQICEADWQQSPFDLEIILHKKNKPSQALYKKNLHISPTTRPLTYQIIDTLDLQNIPNGNYHLLLSMSGKNHITSTQNIAVQRMHPDKNYALSNMKIETTNLAKKTIDNSQNFTTKYTHNQLLKNLNAMKPLLSNFQQKLINDIISTANDTMMRQYFYNFWQDKMPTNPQKAWEDYTQKLNYAVKYYNGIQTDKAHIYLRYGMPTKTEEVRTEANARPYEIWHYDLAGSEANITFLFLETGNIEGKLSLIHSNHPDEINNKLWPKLLFLGPPENNIVSDYFGTIGSK